MRKALKGLSALSFSGNLSLSKGSLAQLGERLHGMQEVDGSNPLGSRLAKLPLFTSALKALRVAVFHCLRVKSRPPEMAESLPKGLPEFTKRTTKNLPAGKQGTRHLSRWRFYVKFCQALVTWVL